MVVEHSRLKRQVALRLGLPTAALLFLSSLDRVNLSFAALSMNADLHFSPTQYAFAAGIVFAGYLAGQYPSILLQQRIGMRRWVACCALLWGLSAATSAFVQSASQLYVARFVLGIAEGGLAPGIVVYLSQFTTTRERGSSIALPMLAIPLSVIIGGPLSGWLMDWGTSVGLAGWRCMLAGEALPTLAIGFISVFYFPDDPEAATWLSSEDKAEIRTQALGKLTRAAQNDWSVLSKSVTWMSSIVWFALLCGAYGLIFWLPQILRQLTNVSTTAVAMLNSMPWVGNACGVLVGGFYSDRSGDRFRYLIIPSIAAGCALLAAAAWHGAGALLMLIVAGFMLGVAQGAFWPLPASLLPPRGFAVGTVTINIAGSMSGLIMPVAIGMAEQRLPGPLLPSLMLCGILLLAGLTVLIMRWTHSGHATLAP